MLYGVLTHTLRTSIMDSLEIKDYSEQLKDICPHCRTFNRCKNKDKLCVIKRLAFSLAKKKYKKNLKEGLANDCS